MLPKAFVAIEDRRFYHHFGIDPLGLARAFVDQLSRRGGGMQGGSTLTQQLAKNLFLTPERTLSRKVQEAILAVWLERKLHQGPDPRALSEPRLFRRRRLWHRGGGAALFRQARPHSSRLPRPRCSPVLQGAGAARAEPRSRRRRGRAEVVLADMRDQGYVTDGMAKVALGARRPGRREPGGGAANYAADFVMDTLDDSIGALDGDIIVDDDDRFAHCRRRPSSARRGARRRRAASSMSARARSSR